LLDPSDFATLDELGRRFYPDDEFSARTFRKLAAFDATCRRFLFVDGDALALSDVHELFRAAERDGREFVHFDTDLDQVYRPGPLREDLERRGSAGFNSGIFLSRSQLLTPESVAAGFEDLDDDWRRVLVPNAEQAFLNLVVDRSGCSKAPAHELRSGFCSTCWAAVGKIRESADGFVLDCPGRWDNGWHLLFAHWAGMRISSQMPNREVFERFSRRAEQRLLANGIRP
jgi:hypothetical protein